MANQKLEQVSIETLIPYARNAKKHSDEQVAQIAASIREFGFNAPVLVDGQNGIIAGHGRVLAARKLELDKVPCIRLTHLTETQRRAYILADNRLAETGGGWDEEMLKLEVKEIDWAELNEISIDDFKFGELDFGTKQEEAGEANPYTAKVEAPIYKPTGERPELMELADQKKFQELLKQIETSKISEQEKEFLRTAARRHIVFHYQKVAEYYAHANKEMQELMEASALVVIDFKKSIELGFTKLTESIASQMAEDFEDES
jgi:hypothetical protein